MNPVKILIIEDDAEIRNNIEEILKENGYCVESAADGDEGIARAKSYLPDLIICDIMMPGKDGYEVLEKMQLEKETRSTPFIFLTAKTERENIRRGMQLGADDYLFKPFKIDEVLTAVDSRLKRIKIFKYALPEKLIEGYGTKTEENDKLYVQTLGSPLIITVKNMVYIKAENQYTLVGMNSKKTILVRRSLTEWMKILPDNKFIRIHRSAAVNTDYIDRIEKGKNSAFQIYLRDTEASFPVSKRYSSQLRRM